MYETTYSNRHGEKFTAVQLQWSDVEKLLGRPHDGSPEDDRALVSHLQQNGAPVWVEDAAGWIDDSGWGLIGPSIESA